MVQIKFAPISTEKEIPGTNITIQLGVIQNDTRSWGVKLAQSGRVIAAKRIKKLIDVEIVGIIRDTVGKKVALDTFELGTTMSGLLREVYEKLQGKKKQAEPQPAPQQPKPAAPQPAPTPSPEPQAPAQSEPASLDFKLPESPPLTTGGGDSFWSSYSNVDTYEVPHESQPAPQAGLGLRNLVQATC